MLRYSVIILLSCCLSCGSRKTQKSQQELNLSSKGISQTSSEIKATTLLSKKEEDVSREDRNYSFSNRKVTPIDSSKPMKYTDPSGKTTTVENGVLEFNSGTDKGITTQKTIKTDNSKFTTDKKVSGKNQQELNQEQSQSSKDTDRDGAGKDIAWGAFSISFLLILLFVLIIIIRKKIYDRKGT